VIVPMVESAEQARRAVRAAKYPPLGNRGYCFGRMNQWGGRFDDYARTANDGTIVVAMIESRAGVENIEAILAVEGLSGVFIGPYDLSGSYGLPGQLQHEVVRRAYDSVVRACRAARVPAGQHIVHSTQAKIETAMAEGFTLICLDADSIFIREAARTALAAATGSTP
jgi:2-keto-3-deoxy-L-rhamnonate aldolase RhmA